MCIQSKYADLVIRHIFSVSIYLSDHEGQSCSQQRNNDEERDDQAHKHRGVIESFGFRWLHAIAARIPCTSTPQKAFKVFHMYQRESIS